MTASTLMPPAEVPALAPLARGEGGADPGDDLKGVALRAVWPGALSTADLLAALTPSTTPGVLGPYRAFLMSGDFWLDVPGDELPHALTWTLERDGGAWMFGALPGSFEHIPWRETTTRLFRRAWACLEMPGVLDALTRALRTRLLHPAGLVKELAEDVRRDAARRRALIAHLLTRDPPSPHEVTWLTWRDGATVLEEDVPWLLTRLKASVTEGERALWLALLRALAHTGAAGRVLSSGDVPPDVRTALAPPPRPMTPEERALLEQHERIAAERAAEDARRQALPGAEERVADTLRLVHGGDADAWWRIPELLLYDERRERAGDEFEPDLRRTPAWPRLGPGEQQAVIDAAPAYLVNSDPETNSWFTTHKLHPGALAGGKALYLLRAERPGVLAALPAEVWAKWAAALLQYRPASGEHDEATAELWRRAYHHAPGEFLARLTALVRWEVAEHGRPLVTHLLRTFVDPGLAAALLDALGDARTPDTVEELLFLATRGDVASARPIIRALIDDRTARQAVAVAAATAFVRAAPGEGWPDVWPILQSEAAFGRAVVERLASQAPGVPNDLTPHLPAGAAAELFEWLDAEYPRADDPDDRAGFGRGSTLTSTRDLVTWWRDGIITELEGRGTGEAVEALRTLAGRLPSWRVTLRRAAHAAQENVRWRAWVPVRPQDLLRLVRDVRARFVRDETHLLDLVVDTLANLQAELRGEIPTAQALWDTHSGRPKGEEDFSDFVAHFLRRELEGRGVVVNREVVIRRRVATGGAPGERTDIHVDALVLDPRENAYGRATVIIEAKGCWNPGVLTAMEDQLVDRYLRDNASRHGLYLVGWFVCPAWKNTDRRLGQVPHASLGEAHTTYGAQAALLSSGGTLDVRACVLDVTLR